jgi:predicted nucleic acid-binding protein
LRICVDLNVWCAWILADKAGKSGTAAQSIVAAVRGRKTPVPIQLVISWGMLERLGEVLRDDFRFPDTAAGALIDKIASYARERPSLTLGGVGVLPIHDAEDRHVLETAWAGAATALVTSDFRGFLSADATVLIPGRLARLSRGERELYLIHPFPMAAWLGGEPVAGFEPRN